MEETFQQLTERLLQRNSRLSVARARTWVELLSRINGQVRLPPQDTEKTKKKGGRSNCP